MKILAPLLLCALLCVRVEANPVLKFISPAGAQRGTEPEVTLLGDGMADAKDIVFYEKGIEVVKFIEKTDKATKLQLRISKDCRLGSHIFRVFGKDQFSKLIGFSVGQFPEIAEKENNDTLTTAQEITMNSTINGILTKEDVDFFKINLKKDELLNAELEANRLAYGFFDAQMSVLDENGAVKEESDDTMLTTLDPYIRFRAPKAGAYYVVVRNSEYDGNPNARYRLHVGAFPRPDAVFPLGGKPGTDIDVSYIFRNGPDLKQKIHVPAENQIFQTYALQDGLYSPSHIPFQVSDIPAFAEKEPNDTRDDVKEFPPVPCVFDGIIGKPKDVDWFGFMANKGDKLTVRCLGRKLRSVVDIVLHVESFKTGIVDQDDNGGPDPLVYITVSDTGKHYLKVWDTLRAGGPEYVYRLEVTQTVPTATLGLESLNGCEETEQALLIPRGGKKFRLFQMTRQGKGEGKETVGFENMPAGVTAQVLDYGEGATEIPVIFSATEGAAENYFFAKPTVQQTGSKGEYHQRVVMNHGDNCRTYYQGDFDTLTLGVGEKSPFKIHLETNPTPLPRLGSHEVKISIEREAKFDGDVQVQLSYKHGEITSVDKMIVPKGQTSIVYKVNANAAMPEGEWPLVFTATARVNNMKYDATADIYRVKVISNFFTAQYQPQVLKQGEAGKIDLTLKSLKAFTGSAKAILMGLPDGVATIEQSLASGATSISFATKTTMEAAAGKYKNIFLRLSIPWEGAVLTQDLYLDGALRIDANFATAAVQKEGGKK